MGEFLDFIGRSVLSSKDETFQLLKSRFEVAKEYLTHACHFIDQKVIMGDDPFTGVCAYVVHKELQRRDVEERANALKSLFTYNINKEMAFRWRKLCKKALDLLGKQVWELVRLNTQLFAFGAHRDERRRLVLGSRPNGQLSYKVEQISEDDVVLALKKET